MRLSKQIYFGGLAYRVVGHPFLLLRNDRFWRILPQGGEGRAWADRNHPGLIKVEFPTRREALDTLQALEALETLPRISPLSRSMLKPREEGGYQVITPRGVCFVITREGGRWMATDGCASFGPYLSLTDVRSCLAEAWHLL